MYLSVISRTIGITCVLYLVLLGLTACEEPVDLGVEIPKSRLVLSSSFLPGEPVVLKVSATRPLGYGPVREIDDAQVSLFEGSELAEVLSYFPGTEGSEMGHYRTKTFTPVVGRDYTIHVSAADFDPVSAISSIPEPVAIRSLEISNLSKTVTGDETLYDYFLRVEYADPEDEMNYYDLRISQQAIPFKLDRNGDTIRLNPYLKTVTTPEEGGLSAATISVLLQDDGEDNSVTLHLQSRLDSRSELLGQIIAELRTVSPEYYFFQRSIARPHEPAGGGVSEPVILYNNVDHGLGVFAGYNYVKEGLHLPSSP